MEKNDTSSESLFPGPRARAEGGEKGFVLGQQWGGMEMSPDGSQILPWWDYNSSVSIGGETKGSANKSCSFKHGLYSMPRGSLGLLSLCSSRACFQEGTG